MAAQDQYKEFLNHLISPALRERGFKGSGGRYELPDEAAYILIGFQKDKWNSQDDVGFTVNLAVVSKKDWAEAAQTNPWMAKKPSANSWDTPKMWTARLGQIRFLKNKDWWHINVATRLEPLSADIIGRIDHDAMPAIARQLNKST